MIRVNYMLKRAPGMSREEFEDYFRNVYGPLVAKHQSRLDLRRYVQSYTLLKDPTGEALRAARPEMHEPFDGTAAFWWRTRDEMEDVLGSSMGFLRYIQSHSIDDPMIDSLRKGRGAMPPYDGLTEVWFDRLYLADVIRSPECEGAEGFGLLLEDEYKFVDLSGSSTWFSKEHILVER